MKELVKPDRIEACYEEIEAFAAAGTCGIDRSCRTRNRCDEQNGADTEVMDEILF